MVAALGGLPNALVRTSPGSLAIPEASQPPGLGRSRRYEILVVKLLSVSFRSRCVGMGGVDGGEQFAA
jgi:hypothetical protein